MDATAFMNSKTMIALGNVGSEVLNVAANFSEKHVVPTVESMLGANAGRHGTASAEALRGGHYWDSAVEGFKSIVGGSVHATGEILHIAETSKPLDTPMVASIASDRGKSKA